MKGEGRGSEMVEKGLSERGERIVDGGERVK